MITPPIRDGLDKFVGTIFPIENRDAIFRLREEDRDEERID